LLELDFDSDEGGARSAPAVPYADRGHSYFFFVVFFAVAFVVVFFAAVFLAAGFAGIIYPPLYYVLYPFLRFCQEEFFLFFFSPNQP